jgi:hypothetical protein
MIVDGVVCRSWSVSRHRPERWHKPTSLSAHFALRLHITSFCHPLPRRKETLLESIERYRSHHQMKNADTEPDSACGCFGLRFGELGPASSPRLRKFSNFPPCGHLSERDRRISLVMSASGIVLCFLAAFHWFCFSKEKRVGVRGALHWMAGYRCFEPAA